jgi:hypothetical protein
MKTFKYTITAVFGFFALCISHAQVGVGNTSPQSALEIKASNKAAPSNTDGLLIPRVNNFPSVNPSSDQDGMLVFLKNASGNYKKGLHYWDDNNSRWLAYAGEWIDGYNAANESLSYAKQANANGVDVVVLDDGSIGMGTDSPEESLELKFEGDNDIQISSNGSRPNAPNMIYFTKGGSFASPNYLNNNAPIGSMTAKAWSGFSKSSDIAYFNMVADGNHSSGSLPTKFTFSVTRNGQTNEAASGIEMVIKESGRVGIGTETPSAVLHLKGGTASAGSAPLKFTAGTNLTTPEAGAMEFDGNHLYFTPGSERRILLKSLTATATLDFPVIVNGITDQLTVAVPGATVGSSCSCAPLGSIETGLKWNCYVSAANTVTVRLSTIFDPLTPIDPASKSWKVTVIE